MSGEGGMSKKDFLDKLGGISVSEHAKHNADLQELTVEGYNALMTLKTNISFIGGLSDEARKTITANELSGALDTFFTNAGVSKGERKKILTKVYALDYFPKKGLRR